jgi:hypothetical protein
MKPPIRPQSLALALCLIATAVFAPGGAPAAGQQRAAAAPASITADYATTTTEAGKFNFGISSWPKLHSKYAELVAGSGITMVRADIYLYDLVPRTTKAADRVTDVPTTVETYNLDLHRRGGPIGAANPKNWNWDPIFDSEIPTTKDLARWKKAGVPLLLIINSVPSWLGHDPSMGVGWYGSDSSVPKDWDIWTDINKKAFAHYKDKADYFESINEPDGEGWSLSLKNSSYSSTLEAYKDIYYYAAKGWRQVKGYETKQFGGPTTASSDPYFLTALLGDPRTRDEVDFATRHSYLGYTELDAHVPDWRAAADAAGKPDLPLFVDEWNYSAAANSDPMNNESPDAISYVGLRLKHFINAGADGSFIFNTNDDQSAFDAEWRNHWTYINNDGQLQPKAATIRLLSKQLDLGEGDFDVNATTAAGDGVTLSAAATNADGERVVWAVNDGTTPTTTDVKLTNLGISGQARLTHYLAAADDDATAPFATEVVPVSRGKASVSITLPPKSVHGIKVLRRHRDRGGDRRR